MATCCKSLLRSYKTFDKILQDVEQILENPARSFHVLKQDHRKILLKILARSFMDHGKLVILRKINLSVKGTR